MSTPSPTYRLSDAQWEQIKDFLPSNGNKGGQWKDHRLLIDGILWALSDGGRWRNLPKEFGPWQTVYDRFRKWCRTACGTKSCAACRHARCTPGRSTGSCSALTARSSGRTSRRLGRRKKNPPAGEPEDHALGRSQGGFSTKLHLICDGEGTPMAVAVGPGQEHETQQAIPLLEEATAWPEQPAKVAGDKGYSAGWLREWLQERGIEPVIAHQKNEKARQGKFDKKTYRRRNIIERCLSSLKWFRRVATRYEKLATHYLGMVTLAIIFRLL